MEQLRMMVHTDLRRLKRLVLASLAAIIVLVIVGGWTNDYRSCVRQRPVREAAQADARIAREGAVYWREHGLPEVAHRSLLRARVLSREKPLDCFSVLPGA